MRMRIVCPEHEAYAGEAAFVVLPCPDGELGVLPGHASEICTIAAGYVRVSDRAMGTVDHRFVVSGGYAQITADEVIVLAERACDVEGIDHEAVRAARGVFEDKLSNLSEDDAHRAYLYNEIAWCELQLGTA